MRSLLFILSMAWVFLACGGDPVPPRAKRVPVRPDSSTGEVFPPQVRERLTGLTWEYLEDSANRFDAEKVVFQGPYTSIPGVLTFRGGPLRDGAAWGTAGEDRLTGLSLAWRQTLPTDTGHWQGVAGWTGQAAIVRWPDSLRLAMNLDPSVRSRTDFVEIIQATLGGWIHFLDLATGLPSRPPIDLGNPVKGSVSVHPSGIPLLFVGQGIRKRDPPGFRLYSLFDGSELFMQPGADRSAWRAWASCDGSALFHPWTDRLLVGSENGILYNLKLNTKCLLSSRTLAVTPSVSRYRYRIDASRSLGMEGSLAAWRNLLFFADNGGWLQAFDVNRRLPVWTRNLGDDTDASVLVREEQGRPMLFVASEVDHQGSDGLAWIRKVGGWDGALIWERSYPCRSVIGARPVNGGILATPCAGRGDSDHLVFFSVARTGGLHAGLLLALDAQTGSEVWRLPLSQYSWSTPTCVVTRSGRSYLLHATSGGLLLLVEARSGHVIDRMALDGLVEASPAVFERTAVLATRGHSLYRIRFRE